MNMVITKRIHCHGVQDHQQQSPEGYIPTYSRAQTQQVRVAGPSPTTDD